MPSLRSVSRWGCNNSRKDVSEGTRLKHDPRCSVHHPSGKQIILLDLSDNSAAEVEQTCRAVPEVVTIHPRSSVGTYRFHKSFFWLGSPPGHETKRRVLSPSHGHRSNWLGYWPIVQNLTPFVGISCTSETKQKTTERRRRLSAVCALRGVQRQGDGRYLSITISGP
jgi:hypothetical protein